MKKAKKTGILILTAILFFSLCPQRVKGENNAVFYVQAARNLENGTVEVSVYLNGVDDLGGIDATLSFDPQKVSFVSSSLGASLNSAYSDINYDEEESTLRYIVLFPDSVEANGILMSVVFTLIDVEAYQPVLTVNSMLDGTDELNEIPYTIEYQQADGSLEETPDTSGTAAEESVVEEALSKYGSPEDQDAASQGASDVVTLYRDNEIAGTASDDSMSSDDSISRESGTTESASSEAGASDSASDSITADSGDADQAYADDNAVSDTETSIWTEQDAEANAAGTNTARIAAFVAAGAAVILIGGICVYVWRRRRQSL